TGREDLPLRAEHQQQIARPDAELTLDDVADGRAIAGADRRAQLRELRQMRRALAQHRALQAQVAHRAELRAGELNVDLPLGVRLDEVRQHGDADREESEHEPDRARDQPSTQSEPRHQYFSRYGSPCLLRCGNRWTVSRISRSVEI